MTTASSTILVFPAVCIFFETQHKAVVRRQGEEGRKKKKKKRRWREFKYPNEKKIWWKDLNCNVKRTNDCTDESLWHWLALHWGHDQPTALKPRNKHLSSQWSVLKLSWEFRPAKPLSLTTKQRLARSSRLCCVFFVIVLCGVASNTFFLANERKKSACLPACSRRNVCATLSNALKTWAWKSCCSSDPKMASESTTESTPSF